MKIYRRYLKWLSLLGAFLIALIAAVILLRRPAKVGQLEGIYSPGEVIQCMCQDGLHFFRFSKGRLIYYTNHGEPAYIVGKYEKNEDGSYTVYSIPLRPDDREEIILQLARPNPAFLEATAPGEEGRAILMRKDINEKTKQVIASREVHSMRFPDSSTTVKQIYDSELEWIREETVTSEESNSEQAESRNDD